MSAVAGVEVLGPMKEGYDTVLTKDALQFFAELHRKFNSTRLQLLQARVERQKQLDAGKLFDFLPETEWIRTGEWQGASVVKDLSDRRVEITGPVDRKMIINALNSGAKVFMADFEDATSPTWDNLIQGQQNLREAINRKLHFMQNSKEYKLKPERELATLMVRPRGWHLPEAHIRVDGQEVSASMFDFAFYFYHNALNAVKRGTGPYFYLPKMESHKEARLWNDIFVYAQQRIGLPVGTIRATVLIETIPAVFEMEEIIYELRAHSAGLNCGRWDYIFSYIKRLRKYPEYVLPDRLLVGMTTPFMGKYVDLLVSTCHRRGVHAMGGMAAQIPINNDKEKNDAVVKKVTDDKLIEVKKGCDGTWVAHPGLIPIAMKVFDQHMPTANQIKTNPGPSSSKQITAKDLLSPQGLDQRAITTQGLLSNLDVGLNYMEAWLRGIGCVPLHYLMEDAATAEISRTQIWQWIQHGASTKEGNKITKEFVKQKLQEVVEENKQRIGEEAWQKRKYEQAAKIVGDMAMSDTLDEFLTSVAYPYITSVPSQQKGRL